MKEVVFAPDLIGAAFVDPQARTVVELWRDREIKIAINRELLALHFKTLRELGLSATLLKRWALWFTSPETATVYSSSETNEAMVTRICEAIPNLKIICSQKPVDASDRWILANEFLRQRL